MKDQLKKDFRLFLNSAKIKKGGSLASDNVMNVIQNELWTKGGKLKYRLHHGAGTGTGIPAPSLTQPLNNMTNSMAVHYAQPLTPEIPSSTNMIYPSYYTTFSPLLTQAGGGSLHRD